MIVVRCIVLVDALDVCGLLVLPRLVLIFHALMFIITIDVRILSFNVENLGTRYRVDLGIEIRNRRNAGVIRFHRLSLVDHLLVVILRVAPQIDHN